MKRTQKRKANVRSQRRTIRGGGYATTSSLMQFNPANDTQFAVKSPVYQQYNDCYAQSRPGAIANPAAPELTQTVMAGGMRGGGGCGMRGGGSCGMRGGGSCGMRGGGSCGMRGGGGMRGGRSRRVRGGGGCGMRGGRSRRQRGGSNNGFAVQPNMSVGGNGPVAAPVYAGVPCDARAGFPNPQTPSVVNPDIRAPSDLYSLTPNAAHQRGGSLANEECSRTQMGGSGNGFSADCYRAPNSMIPVYPAESAGFHFRPSTEFGSTLPDGVTAYNDVVPQAARLGGARRANRRRR